MQFNPEMSSVLLKDMGKQLRPRSDNAELGVLSVKLCLHKHYIKKFMIKDIHRRPFKDVSKSICGSISKSHESHLLVYPDD